MTDRDMLTLIYAQIGAHLSLTPQEPPPPQPPQPPSGDIQTGGMNVYFISDYAGEERTYTFMAAKAKHLVAVNTHTGGVGHLGPIDVQVLYNDGAVMMEWKNLDPPMLNAWINFMPGVPYAVRVKLHTGGAVAVAVQ